MTREEIAKKVDLAIKGIFNRSLIDCFWLPTSRLGNDDICFDELDVVELMIAIENVFGIALEDDAFSVTSTVYEVVDVVCRLLGEKAEHEARSPSWKDFPDDAA